MIKDSTVGKAWATMMWIATIMLTLSVIWIAGYVAWVVLNLIFFLITEVN